MSSSRNAIFFIAPAIAILAGAAATRPVFARDGRVVIQFDDGRLNQYENAFPLLEQYHLKGTFGVITAHLGVRASSMTPAMVVDLARHGHEVHDHTLHHNPAFWGDTLNVFAWGDTIRRSTHILRNLGLGARCWNQPGGAGEGWSRALRDTLARYYNFCAGRVGMPWERATNSHWNLLDDPMSLGRGGVYSWGYNAAAAALERAGIYASDDFEVERKSESANVAPSLVSAGAALELKEILRRIVDGYEQGLVVIPVFHSVLATDSSAWALDSLCHFVAASGMREETLGEVFYHMVLSAPFYENQIPNPRFAKDRNNDGIADGWKAATPGGTLTDRARTTVYGPERGRTILHFRIRSPSGYDNVRVVETVTRISGVGPWHTESDYHTETRYEDVPVTASWTEYNDTLWIGADVDRVGLDFLGIYDTVEIDSLTFTLVPLLASGIRDGPPRTTRLQVAPNPFGSMVALRYTLIEPSRVALDVYDAAGRLVYHAQRRDNVGAHAFVVPGSQLAAGVYFARLCVGGHPVDVRKLVRIP